MGVTQYNLTFKKLTLASTKEMEAGRPVGRPRQYCRQESGSAWTRLQHWRQILRICFQGKVSRNFQFICNEDEGKKGIKENSWVL